MKTCPVCGLNEVYLYKDYFLFGSSMGEVLLPGLGSFSPGKIRPSVCTSCDHVQFFTSEDAREGEGFEALEGRRVKCDEKHYGGPGGRGTRPYPSRKEASYEKAPGLASVCRNLPRGARDSVGEVIRLLEGQEAEEGQLLIAKDVGEELDFPNVDGQVLIFEEIIKEGRGGYSRVTHTVTDTDTVTDTVSVSLTLSVTSGG